MRVNVDEPRSTQPLPNRPGAADGVRRRPSRARVVAVVGGAAVLGWLVLSKSMAAYLANGSPRVALLLNPADPSALTRLASDRLAEFVAMRPRPANEAGPAQAAKPNVSSEARTALDADVGLLAAMQRRRELTAGPQPAPQPDRARETEKPELSEPEREAERAKLAEEIRRLCARAIAAAPLDPRPFRILAELANETGDTDKAGVYFAATAARSRHEPMAYYDMLVRALEAKDYATAVQHANTILRTTPGAMTAVAPLLVAMAETSDAAPLVKQMLSTNPPWRALFFSTAMVSITDARTPLQLLLSLKSTPFPPTDTELKRYLDFLISRNFSELAYYTWLQFLPPEKLAEAGLLFNADLRSPPSGLPFDWVIGSGRGVTVDFQPVPDGHGERGLSVDFAGGRVDFSGVSQRVLLVPGGYVLSGRYKGEVSGRRGLKWRVTCAPPENELLSETPMIIGRQPTWKEFSLAFTVPEKGCTTQIVRLDLDARSASETLVSGTSWFTGLNLSRQPPPLSPPDSGSRQGASDAPKQ